jgi:hypothetical protein
LAHLSIGAEPYTAAVGTPTKGTGGGPACEDDGVLHLRLVVPPDLTDVVIDELEAAPGVVHIVQVAGSATQPDGQLVLCDVVREAANEVLERLQAQGVARVPS